MGIDQLPTDNLHKFKTLSGLALVLFSLTFPVKFFHDLRLREFEVKRHTAKAQAEYEVWLGQHQLLASAALKHTGDMQKLRSMAEEVPPAKRTEDQKRILAVFATSIDQESLRNKDQSLKNVEQGKLADQMRGEVAANDQELSYLAWATWWFLVPVGMMCFVGGVWLSANGFRQWEQHQRLQDQLLAAEVKAAATKRNNR